MMRTTVRTMSAALALALAGAACATTESPDATPDTSAAVSDTRAALDQLLGEHVYLASIATGHALGGRSDEFTAAAAALEDNSRAISAALAAPLGKTSEQVFELWDSHVQMVVRYTQAVAGGDDAAAGEEVQNLLAYAATFGSVIGDATGLPPATVEELVVGHITTLKSVIDAQAKGKHAKASSAVREAYAHMDMIAEPLARAIAG